MDDFLLKAVVLCGGQSTRMGRPKHDLKLSDGRSVVSHLIERIRAVLWMERTVHISLCDPAQTFQADPDDELQYVYDVEDSSSCRPVLGPASGLLAAHHRHPTAHWLVIACDYPLISVDDLRQLHQNYESPVTCFENAEGWPEPLLAIWSPSALQALEENVQMGITGPIKTLKALSAKRLKPINEKSLLNANTPAEWETVMRSIVTDGTD